MYYLAQNNEKTGPFTLEQLRTMWREGGVYPQTLYWEEGMADWQPLGAGAAGRLGLAPAPAPTAPVAAAMGTDSLFPPTTSHEPSAYDLPAGRLPAAPPPSPPSTGLPTAVAGLGPAGPLIESTRLPGGGVGAGGVMSPAGPGPLAATSSAEMPPAAYLSLIFSLAWPFSLIFHLFGGMVSMGMIVAAVVCGHSARASIRQSGGRLPGWGIATAGLTIGYLSLALGLAIILLMVAFMVFALYSMASGHHGG